MSDDKHPVKRFQSATNILQKAIENAETPAMNELDWDTVKSQCYQDILNAITTNDALYLHRAIDYMVKQSTVKDVASDMLKCKHLMKQYGPQ
jgi:hypothetical protein